MSNSSSYRYTRNNDTRSCRTTRPSRGSVIRLLLVSTTLLLTLSSWATPSMASEQDVEGSDSRPLTPRLDRPSGTTKPEAQSPKADEVFVGEDDVAPAPSPALAPRAVPTSSASGASSDNTRMEVILDQPSPNRKFYGHKLILADGVADSAWVTGAVFGGICSFSGMDFTGNGGGGGDNKWACGTATVFLSLGAGTFLLAPPIIHGAHHRPEAAVGSLGLRASVIGLGAFLESAGEDSAFLVVNHLIGTRLIDWLVLAREKPEIADQRRSEVTLRPTFLLDRHNTEVGLRGQF